MANHNVQLYTYNADEMELQEGSLSEAYLTKLRNEKSNKIKWINFHGFDDKETIEATFKAFGVHRLTKEDILQVSERPKIEGYEDYIFVTLKCLRPGSVAEVQVEQISFLLFENTLISFQEHLGDSFKEIRGRITENTGVVRKKGSEYLLYLLITKTLSEYEDNLLIIDKKIAEFTESIRKDVNADILDEIEQTKDLLRDFRSALHPFRDQVNTLINLESKLLPPSSRPYFSDMKDNILFSLDEIENQKSDLEALNNLLFGKLSQRSNEIMQFLTIVASIFIPLTFIAGVYGMNFQNMPELKSENGYYIVVAVMIAMAAGLIIYFKKKKWF
ncbi:MAG: magnesium/cobalt transporter CorA [Crocinitomicaceae bacterium]